MEQNVDYKLYLNEYPQDGKFNRVHAILLTKDGRVLLRYKNGEPRITGGRIIDGEQSLEETLQREVLEELNCEIDRCDYLGYIECDDGYWARMVARVSKILPPKPDPDRAGNWIYGRVLAPREIAYEEMTKVDIFGMNNGKLLDAAYKIAREKEYFTEMPSQEYETLNVESRD